MSDRRKHTIKAKESLEPSQTRQEWERLFIARLSQDKTADRAWRQIEKACKPGVNLDLVVAAILFQAARMDRNVIAEIRSGLKKQVQALKAAHRAHMVAMARTKDTRARLFGRRRMRTLQIAAQTPWPFHNPKVRTLHDAALAYPQIGTETIEQAPHSAAKGAERLRRWEPRKLLLAMLRAGLHAYGVDLSPRALAALAWCADANREIDERSLRRFLADPTLKQKKQDYVKIFESHLNQSELALISPAPTIH